MSEYHLGCICNTPSSTARSLAYLHLCLAGKAGQPRRRKNDGDLPAKTIVNKITIGLSTSEESWLIFSPRRCPEMTTPTLSAATYTSAPRVPLNATLLLISPGASARPDVDRATQLQAQVGRREHSERVRTRSNITRRVAPRRAVSTPRFILPSMPFI